MKLSNQKVTRWPKYFSFYFLFFFTPLDMLFVMKTLEDDWYVKLLAYKFTVFVILKIFVLSNNIILCSRYPYI